MLLPSVLFISTNNLDSKDLIKSVLKSEELPQCKIINENINAYEWHIDNKYYTTNVNLCTVTEKVLPDVQFSHSVEAIIIKFGSGLQEVESWIPFFDFNEPEIKILVCERCDNEDSKRTVLEWCIGKGFELVEINPDLSDVDPEDDFPETLGVDRIRQALNAHTWPNLVLKEESHNQFLPNNLQRLIEEVRQENGESDDEDDIFGELLSKLNDMKTEVGTLTGNDRKVAAEQIVNAFWQAIGGDDDI